MQTDTGVTVGWSIPRPLAAEWVLDGDLIAIERQGDGTLKTVHTSEYAVKAVDTVEWWCVTSADTTRTESIGVASIVDHVPAGSGSVVRLLIVPTLVPPFRKDLPVPVAEVRRGDQVQVVVRVPVVVEPWDIAAATTDAAAALAAAVEERRTIGDRTMRITVPPVAAVREPGQTTQAMSTRHIPEGVFGQELGRHQEESDAIDHKSERDSDLVGE